MIYCGYCRVGNKEQLTDKNINFRFLDKNKVLNDENMLNKHIRRM